MQILRGAKELTMQLGGSFAIGCMGKFGGFVVSKADIPPASTDSGLILSTVEANPFEAKFVVFADFSVDGVLKGRRHSKVCASVVESVSVPMVNVAIRKTKKIPMHADSGISVPSARVNPIVAFTSPPVAKRYGFNVHGIDEREHFTAQRNIGDRRANYQDGGSR